MRGAMIFDNGAPAAVPFFSIIMPCFNSEAYLEQSINSVLSQSETDFELIIVDDGSEDDSQEVVHRFAQHDGRIHLIPNNGCSGAAGARNYGVKLARGRWLCFLDSDDLYAPEALSRRKLAIESHPGCRFFSSDFILWRDEHGVNDLRQTQSNELWARYFDLADEHGLHLLDKSVIPVFLRAPLAWTGGVCLQRQLFLELGGFDESLVRAEDDHLWIRAAAKTGVVGLINFADVYYRLRSSGLSQGGGSLSPCTPAMIRKLMRDPLLAGHRKQLRSKLELEAYLLSLHYRSRGMRGSAVRYALESYWASFFNYRKFRNLMGALLLRT